jgi:hypothetical protein
MRRAALLVLGIGSPLLLLTLLVGAGWAGVAFVLISLLFPTAFCVAGAARGSLGGTWKWILPLVGATLLLSAAGILSLHARGDGGVRVLGLPPAALLLLVGLGLLPLLLTGLGYAADFRRRGGRERPPAAPRGSGGNG